MSRSAGCLGGKETGPDGNECRREAAGSRARAWRAIGSSGGRIDQVESSARRPRPLTGLTPCLGRRLSRAPTSVPPPGSSSLASSPTVPVPAPSSILAHIFRQQSPRSPVPPSSFPQGLQPVASRDVNGLAGRRVSRTELDFEEALHAGGTVLLKEGFDVDALGADITNTSIALSSPPSPPAQRGYRSLQPATPIVVPPTPSPGNSASRSAALPSAVSLTPSSSATSEVFYDAPEEIDAYQTRRRSMYRSPGTASSPDLATLLRRTKERAGAGEGKDGKKSGSSSRERECCSPPISVLESPSSPRRLQHNPPRRPYMSPQIRRVGCAPPKISPRNARPVVVRVARNGFSPAPARLGL